ncbi:MAG: ABC transporter, ATP-binding protein [uncultured Thiotrichaceae bacterium]|uniref:ABC transporter, ATP-binding protein n=1 Tax=uncultured Thiotrichaceae bacterium TaxID=298394 RepID=A0A6S6TN72_9GAMM|nr:MAG: ABC transporter, ATP-binding protein [uncultured Thiotrichaceae bacterium]
MTDIVLENVNFSYGKKTVLENFSLSIKGEGFTALLGANGAGKSTIFNLIAGILVSDQGKIMIGDVNAHDRLQRHTANMGFVFQENTLDPELSVQQNIRYFAGLFGLKNYQPRVEVLLKEFGLWQQRSEKAASLNGGHRRRLEIVRALLPNPEILILDEPTSGLDPTIRQEISNQVHALAKQGVNVVWITHLLDEIEEHDQVILLEKGRIKEQGTFAELGGAQGIKSKFVAKEALLQL